MDVGLRREVEARERREGKIESRMEGGGMFVGGGLISWEDGAVVVVVEGGLGVRFCLGWWSSSQADHSQSEEGVGPDGAGLAGVDFDTGGLDAVTFACASDFGFVSGMSLNSSQSLPNPSFSMDGQAVTGVGDADDFLTLSGKAGAIGVFTFSCFTTSGLRF